MAYCSKCGEELPEGARFCSNCGVPVKVTPVVKPPKRAKPTPKITTKELGRTINKWRRGLKKTEPMMWRVMCIVSVALGSLSLGMAVFLSMLPKEALPVQLWRLAGMTAFFVAVGIIFLAIAPLEYLHSRHLEEKLEKASTT